MRTAFRTGVAVTLVLVAMGALAQPPAPRGVLTLYWGAEDLLVNVAIDSVLRPAFQSRDGSMAYYAEYLESDTFPDAHAMLALRDYLRQKYAGRRIDAVVAVADPACRFLLEHRAELFPDAPIVFSGTTVPQPATLAAAPGVTGVLSTDSYADTLDMALRLHPEVTRVLVVANAPDNGALQRLAAKELERFAGRVELVYVPNLPLADLERTMREASRGSLVLFIRHSIDDPASRLASRDIAPLVAAAAPVPVYGIAESYMGSGIVGGVVYSSKATASLLVGIVSRILAGAAAPDIPMERVPVTPVFDWRQLRRWGIAENDLPAGSEILFRETSLYERNRWFVAGAVTLVAIQALMIATLVMQRSRRRASEARNVAILRAVPDLMFVLDKDGVYLDYHAPEGTELLLPPGQFIGRNMRAVLPPRALDTLNPLFDAVWKTDRPVVAEYTLQIDGSERRYEARMVQCESDKVLSVVRDITDRTLVEVALSASEQRYALATAAGRAGVWDWNLETNDVYTDPLLKALLGFEDDEIPNRLADWQSHIHPDDVRLLDSLTRSYLAGETPVFEIELRMLHRDGSTVWFLSRGSAVYDSGRPTRLVGTSTDITERKQADEALRHSHADLDRMSRLAALGEFAASIAHEVSQPLTAIIMNARTCLRWLADSAPDVTELRLTLLDVVEAGKRADAVIRRNRELFRHHTVDRRPLDINDVINEVTVLTSARLAANRVTLRTRAARGLPPVFGDRIELCQVLLNLIANGIDAMQTVDAKDRVLTLASELNADGEVQVSVGDTGVGLEGVDVDRMFSSVYTTKPRGTGVGLSISRAVVEAHGGRIWAADNDGPGATFSFTVPTQAQALGQGEAQAQAQT